MKINKLINNNLHPFILSVAAFILLLSATIIYTNYKQGQWEKDVRANLLDVLISKKSKLEKALYSRIYYTRGVAAFVALKPQITTEEFNALAQEYIKNDSIISSMALSPNCVLRDIYPLEGHEAAIGLELLKHPERKEIVEKTIETHLTFVAGPVELVEGGTAFLSYTPIFDKTNSRQDQFWGVTDIVIRERSLLNEARFKSSENGYLFALRGYNGTAEKGAVFWGEEAIFNNNPVTIHIDLPIGSWVLAGVPENGWNQYPDQDKVLSFVLIISSLIISILIWLFSKALLKIRQNEKELKAIFGSMDNLIVEYNSKGEYVKIAPTNNSILYKPAEELLGKNVIEIFGVSKGKILLEAIEKCLRTKSLTVIEYPLEIDGKEHWFLARIYYKSSDSVIFNAFDNTEKRRDEQIIKESEQKLKEMNEMKDKFFSILAHDLRNPVGNLKTMTDLIVEDYSTMKENIRIELLESMRSSTTTLHLLLEDLLEWSRSQSGKITVKKQPFWLKEVSRKIIDQVNTAAREKEIELTDQTDDQMKLLADPDFTGTILRNLIVNAIKFTNRGGKIKIEAEKIANNDQQFCRILVSDNGIGISSDRLNKLFKVEKSYSTPGTEDEKGTGIGLLLCKELAEKQNGTITVESVPGKGSTFSVMVPLG